MFPESYTWNAVWTNVQSMIALPVVLGAFIITLSLWFVPLLIKSLMGLMGVNPILKSYQVVDDLVDEWGARPWRDDDERSWHRPGRYRDADTDWRD